MLTTDFEYDGLSLSSFGFVLCNFDSDSMETVSNGSVINFNTTPISNGSKHLLTHSNYDECITSTFTICKDPCNNNYRLEQIEYITPDEISKIMRWLNRKTFKKFKLKKTGYENIYFESSFNVSKIVFNDNVIGFELEMITNRPFALNEPITYNFSTTTSNQKITIDDTSDEIGFSYVEAVITCKQSGDLTIHNSIENRTTIVKNCIQGEKITFKHPIITSSIGTHKIQNDFNFMFPRLANTYSNTKNVLTFSIPCDIKIIYTPIRKVGI